MARLHAKEGSRPAQDGLMPFEGATQPAPAFAFAAWVVFLSKAQFGKDPRPQEGTEQAHEAVAQGVAPHHIGQQGLKADADGYDKCNAPPKKPLAERNSTRPSSSHMPSTAPTPIARVFTLSPEGLTSSIRPESSTAAAISSRRC